MNRNKVIAPIAVAGVVAVLGIVGGFFYFNSGKENDISVICERPTHDFGQIPNVNGRVVGIHKFKVLNPLNVDILIEKTGVSCSCLSVEPLRLLKANEENFVIVSMTLNANQWVKREENVMIVPADKRIKPFSLKLSGLAEFRPIFSLDKIDFGNVSSETKQNTILTFHLPSKNLIPKVVGGVAVKGKYLTVDVLPQVDSRLDKPEDELYIIQTGLDIALLLPKELPRGEGSAEVEIVCFNGVKYTIPVKWFHIPRKVFDVETYFLNQRIEGDNSFQITFNNDIAGEIKDYLIQGEDFKILSAKQFAGHTLFTIQCTTSQFKTTGKVGALVVNTATGHQYQVPFECVK